MDEPINNNNSMSFFKFGNQDLPVFREVKNKDYVYYGEKNDFPYYLIDNYTECAFHKAIIDFKVDYICGGGWGIEKEGLDTEQKALAARILEQPFNLDSDLDDATLRWTLDLQLFNGLTIKGNWSTDGKTATLSYIDMANVRTNADESMFFYTSKWFVQNMGTGQRSPNNKVEDEKDFKRYPKYNPKERKGEFIYYWKAPYPTQKVYPIPVYQGAMRAISIDIALDKYFHNIVTNGFTPTHLINFYNGEPTQEKSRAIEKMIKDKWSGVNGQPIIVNFAKSKDTSADVQTLQMTDADKQYQEVSRQSQQKIITGHKLTSGMLIGLKTEGQLGGRTELQIAEEQFQNNYVRGQQFILEKIINEFAKDFGMTAKFYLKKVQRIKYMFSDATIDSLFTPEEKRQYMSDQLGIKTKEQTTKNPAVELLKNISSISPLIANKVLESLSVAEIRDMVGLPPTPMQTVTTTTNTQFSKQLENVVIEKFESIAKDYSNSKLIYEREINDFDPENIRKSEQDFMSMRFAENIKANTLERSIIDLLSKDSTMQPEAIAKATKTSIDKVKGTIADLLDRKLLKISSIETPNDSVKTYEITDLGTETLDQKPAKTAKIEVVYRYGLSSEFKGKDEILETSHEFCKRIFRLSKEGKRWRSEDIFAMDNETDPKYGMNAWANRGGWYTRPNTEIHIPHCRHSWIQELRSVITD